MVDYFKKLFGFEGGSRDQVQPQNSLTLFSKLHPASPATSNQALVLTPTLTSFLKEINTSVSKM